MIQRERWKPGGTQKKNKMVTETGPPMATAAVARMGIRNGDTDGDMPMAIEQQCRWWRHAAAAMIGTTATPMLTQMVTSIVVQTSLVLVLPMAIVMAMVTVTG